MVLVCNFLIRSALVSIVLFSMRMNSTQHSMYVFVQQSSCHVDVCQQLLGIEQ